MRRSYSCSSTSAVCRSKPDAARVVAAGFRMTVADRHQREKRYTMVEEAAAASTRRPDIALSMKTARQSRKRHCRDAHLGIEILADVEVAAPAHRQRSTARSLRTSSDRPRGIRARSRRRRLPEGRQRRCRQTGTALRAFRENLHRASYLPGKNEGSARSRMVRRPGAAASTFGIEFTTRAVVATSPWIPPGIFIDNLGDPSISTAS